jgi:hypothetical protein
MKLIVFAAVLFFCFVSYGQDAPGSVLSSPGQRFVFGQVSPYAKHQYMIDTKTGRLWQLVRSSLDTTCLVLDEIPYIKYNPAKENFDYTAYPKEVISGPK